jgi:hypothetical protein
MGWDGMGWDGMGWDGMGWDGMGWDGMGWDWIGLDWIGLCCGRPGLSALQAICPAGRSWVICDVMAVGDDPWHQWRLSPVAFDMYAACLPGPGPCPALRRHGNGLD